MAQVPECIVCLQPYDETLHVPRLLACGHSYCEVCLRHLQSSSATSSGSVIRCPECSHRTRLSAGGERSLPKNIALLRLLPSLSRQPADEPTEPTASSSREANEDTAIVEVKLHAWTIRDSPESPEPPASPLVGSFRRGIVINQEISETVRGPIRRSDFGNELPASAALTAGESLVSISEEYTFTNQHDGNLCVWDDEGFPRWDAEIRGEGRGDVMLLTDGNLVLFDTEGTGKPIWAAMSQKRDGGPFSLIMQDDGNLVIYGAHHVATWSTLSDTSSGIFVNSAGNAAMSSGVTWLQTCDKLVSRNRNYTFVNQGDGNLCTYDRDGTVTWSSGTCNKGAGNLYLQEDGDLVLYNTNGDVSSPGAVIWSSGTLRRGSGPYKLVMQDDGDLVIYDTHHRRIWDSTFGAVEVSFVTRSELAANGTLHSGEALVSERQEYTFINQHSDGNLVTYTKYGQPTWASGTGPSSLSGGGDLKLLTDGNVVLYDTMDSGKPFWASMSQGVGRSAGPYKMVMQDDGNLVIYGISAATWATRTLDTTSGRFLSSAGSDELFGGVSWLEASEMLVSRNKLYKFVNQGDGNLCIYKRNGKVTWSSGTWGKGSGNLYMQRDGNLVLYNTDGDGAPIWSSTSFGRGVGPYKLVMQDDGNLMINDARHETIWASTPGARSHAPPTISDTLCSGNVLRTNEQLVSNSRRFSFVNQGDGNLVVYNQHHSPLWATGTNNHGVGNLHLHADGTLVLYNGNVANPRSQLWSSGGRRGRAGPYKLILQDDGNLVIYDAHHHPTWATNVLG